MLSVSQHSLSGMFCFSILSLKTVLLWHIRTGTVSTTKYLAALPIFHRATESLLHLSVLYEVKSCTHFNSCLCRYISHLVEIVLHADVTVKC